MTNDFSNKPSINDLADRIAGLSADKRALLELEIKKRGTRASAESIMPRSDSRDSVPLSFAQQRLWFLDQYEPNSSVYNVSAALRFTGKLNTDALERGIKEIVGRHEALRTTFSIVDGEPVQIIAPAPNLSLPVVDLGERLESEREQEARRLAREEALRPFDLTRGPLFRATLIRLSATDHILLLTLHHIVADGWSLSVLYRELSALYAAFAGGKPSPLEPLPVQYADFAVWQRGWMQGAVLESQLSYPVLSYYRSQHDNQSWLSALTAVLDTCTLLIAGVKDIDPYQAQLTFAMSRHAVVDLALVFKLSPPVSIPERLPPEEFNRLRELLLDAGLPLNQGPAFDAKLAELRAMYEPFVEALAQYFLVALPHFVTEKPPVDNWQTSPWTRRVPGIGQLPLPVADEHFSAGV